MAAEQAQLREWDDYGNMSYAPPIAPLDTPADSIVIGTGVARKLQLCQALGVRPCQSPAKPSAASGAPAPDNILALSAQESQASNNAPQTHIEILAATVHGAPNVLA